MKSSALLAGVLFLVGTAVQQASLPAPLAKHFDKLNTTPSLKVTYAFRQIGESPVEYTLELAKPNLFRLSSAEGFYLSDGKKIYHYTKKDNKYTEAAVTDDSIAEFARKPEVYAWTGFLEKKIVEDIAVAKAGTDRTVQGAQVSPVEITMKKGPSGTLFLDKKLGIARGFSVKVNDKDYLAMATEIEAGTEAVPAEKYAFAAPAGAQKAEVADASAAPTYAQVQDLMTKNCMPCHSAGGRRGGFDLTNYDGIVAAVTPGKGADSVLVKSMRKTGPGRMPAGRAPLPDAQITLIEKWIDGGAKK